MAQMFRSEMLAKIMATGNEDIGIIMKKSLYLFFEVQLMLSKIFLVMISVTSLQIACAATDESEYIFDTAFEAISSFYENGHDNAPKFILNVAELEFIQSIVIPLNRSACFVAHKSKELRGWISGPECEKRISDIPRIVIKSK
jgi:hypothetical protein